MSNTLFIGKVCRRFDELPSTNDYVRQWLAESPSPPEGAVVRADFQSAGRGQFQNRWESAAGENLLLSIVLYPVFLRASDQFRLSEAVSLALRDCVADLLPQSPVKIKWPNDIYIGDEKAAGILIQNSIVGAWLQSAIVGIGLNVNQLDFSAAAPRAISLRCAAARFFDLDATADWLFKKLEMRYLQLKSGANMSEAYRQQLYRLEEEVPFRRADGSFFRGKIIGTTKEGRLLILNENKAEEAFLPKEVAFV